jgi:AraC-like DNA-binding protein
MGSARERMGVVRFSTDDLPECDRLSMWRDIFGRAIMKVESEPLTEAPFLRELSVRAASDVTVRSSSASPAVVRRTVSLVADGDDNFVLSALKRGQLTASQGKREVFLDQGGAFLWSNAEPGTSTNPTTRSLVTISLGRSSLEAAIKDIDAAVTRLIPPSVEALRLLTGYVDILLGGQKPMAPELLALSASHIRDLAVLAIGATRDAEEAARNGGLRAARLLAVKTDILANLTRPDLSIERVASRQGISSRYIGGLFSSDQTTFGDFVREQRLQLAYRMLCSSQERHRSISGIAMSCGFGDVSHFNHCFRQRFGETPSGVRAKEMHDILE